MFNILKKLVRLYQVISTKQILNPPVNILNSLTKKRLPDDVLLESRNKRFNVPIKTLFYLYDWLKFESITKMPDGRFVINSFLPPMPGKGYERMFNNLVSGRRISPVSAYIAVTSNCTYDCWHCSYKNREQDELSLEIISETIDNLVDIGVSIIGLTGGEPTLRTDLVDIVTKISNNADSMIFTNGFGFDDHLALKLKHAGLWAVAVSLDSHLPEEHNKKRGSNIAYTKAIEAIKVAKRHSFYTMLTTVPDRDILISGNYKEIYKLARELSVDEFRLVEPMPTGKLFSCDSCLLDDKLREDLKKFHKEINKKNLIPKVCSFALIESEEYFGCCAGSMHLFIDSAGNVCPCDFTPLMFGNIKEISLQECWQRMNDTFKLPRKSCFIQENYQLIRDHYTGTLPLSYEKSLEIFKKVEKSDLPAYFKHVMHQGLVE